MSELTVSVFQVRSALKCRGAPSKPLETRGIYRKLSRANFLVPDEQ